MSVLLPALPRATTYSMRLISAANTLTPAFGGAVQRLARKGSRFALDITVPALKQAGCGMSLITDLTLGEVETIVAAIPEGRAAADYGAPLVVGAGHAGTSLPIDGLLADVVVPKGKFLSIIMAGRRYVHLVTAEATASAGGEATLAIWPMLRRPPADNDVVELATPMIEGFIEPGQGWSISRLDAVGVSFTIEERA